MALHVLAYNLKRVINIMGVGPLIAAIAAFCAHTRPIRHTGREFRTRRPHQQHKFGRISGQDVIWKKTARVLKLWVKFGSFQPI